MKAANERMSVKIANNAQLEKRIKEQEDAAAAQLDALAAEAASQLESAHKQQVGLEMIASAEVAQRRALEQQIIALEKQLKQQQEKLHQQQQELERYHQESCNSNVREGASHHMAPSLSPIENHDSAVSGVGSRWSLVMKEQLRSQQQRRYRHDVHEGAGAPGSPEFPAPSSPSTDAPRASEAAIVSHHNDRAQQLQQETDSMRGQLLKMQKRAETSEAQLQQLLAASSHSALTAAAAPFSPQHRNLASSPAAASTFVAEVAAADDSNLLQLSQLTAQVVLDCRRMTEVNNSQLREMQVKRLEQLAHTIELEFCEYFHAIKPFSQERELSLRAQIERAQASSLSDAVAADQQQMHQQLRHITQQIERLDELLRVRISVAEHDPNASRQRAVTPQHHPEHADATPIPPENANASLSSIGIQQQAASVSPTSPTLFLQQDKRRPYLQQLDDGDENRDNHRQQQQQQKMFMDDVTSRIGTLKELFACVFCIELHRHQ